MCHFKETFSKHHTFAISSQPVTHNKHNSLTTSGPLNTFSLCDLGAGRAFCGPVDEHQASSPECLTAQRALRPVDTSGGKQHSAWPTLTAYVSHSAVMCSRTSEWTRGKKKNPDPYLQQMFWVNEGSVFFPRVSCGGSVVGCYLRKMSSLAPRSPESPPVRMQSAGRPKQSPDEFNLLRS